ncbi:MAG: sugar-binding protein [Armatimonadetes bacterium]|nr:sugar-binding protein [Armatimonadota bacterium]
MVRLVYIAALVVAAMVLLPSCGRQSTTRTEASKRVKVALVANCTDDFWVIARAGMKQAEKDFNVDADLRLPTSATAAEQKALVENVLAAGTSGVAISPMNPANQRDLLDYIASKVHLVCMDSDDPGSKRICYIGTSNVPAGREVGNILCRSLPNGGKVMLFIGNLEATNAPERIRGVKEAIKGSKIQILGVRTDDTDHAKAKANAEDTLTKHPDISGLVGLWSYNAPACAEAVKAAGKVGMIKIVSFDQDEATLRGIKDGVIEATVAQNPYMIAYESVRVLAALARGEDPKIPNNQIIDTGVTLVDKSNVDSFWRDLKVQKEVHRAR